MECRCYQPHHYYYYYYYCNIIHTWGCCVEMVAGIMTAASLVTRQPLRVIGSAIKGNGEAREQNKKEKKKQRTHGSPHFDV